VNKSKKFTIYCVFGVDFLSTIWLYGRRL